MKPVNYFIALCFLMLLAFTSCSYNESPDIINNGKGANEQTINENSANKSDLRETMPNDFSYKLLKPLISNKGLINYSELALPSKVNELKMAVWLIFDKQRLLVVLYEDTIFKKSREIGFYNFVTNEYETLFTIQKDGEGEHSISICAVDGTNILYKDSVFENINDLLGIDTLCVFNTETKEIVKVHEYSKDYMESGAAYSNKVILHNGMVYYDEVELTDGELSGINLFQFDLQSESVSLVKEWAQNPIIYNEELFSVVKDDTSSDFYFQSVDANTRIKLGERINELMSTGTELYILNNKYLDEKNRSTVWNIENLISGEELLTATIAIDQLNGNNNVLTWTNFFPEKPIIYLKCLDKFVIFDELEKGYISYELSDEVCILTHRNDYNAIKYYTFTLNE